MMTARPLKLIGISHDAKCGLSGKQTTLLAACYCLSVHQVVNIDAALMGACADYE